MQKELTPEEKKNLDNRFTFHPVPNDEVAQTYEQIRAGARVLALGIMQRTVPSREQSLALTAIEEAVFWANAAVARHDENGERR